MKKLYKEIGLLIVGCLLFSFYISVLLAPNEIGSGGLTGVSLGLHYLFNFPTADSLTATIFAGVTSVISMALLLCML